MRTRPAGCAVQRGEADQPSGGSCYLSFLPRPYLRRNLVHLNIPAQLAKLLKMRGSAVLAAMDANRPENSPISRKYNITGFPTLLYFEGGSLLYPYPGGNSKDEIKKFLADPKPEGHLQPMHTGTRPTSQVTSFTS